MRKILGFTLLSLLLAACGNLLAGGAPAVAPAPTETPVSPTATFTPPPTRRVEPVETITPTLEAVPIPATPLPTEPIPPVLTPDAYQVEHWQEYQTELAKALFVYNPEFPQWSYGSDVSKDAICEWDILGWSDQEMYLWVACISANGLSLRTNPAVVYLELDDSIQKVNVPNVEVNHRDQTETYDLQLFPIGIQEKLCLYYFYGFVPQCHEITPAYIPSFDLRREGVFLSHLKYRKTHPEEPPLIVLSVLPTASLTP